MKLGKYSFGLGDRFAQEGEAQLKAVLLAKDQGVDITPVWNKSHREHKTVKSLPVSVQEEAENAVKNLNWNGSYFVDADHINLNNVEGFIPFSTFFTIDVAEYIGKPASKNDIDRFIEANRKYIGKLSIPGIDTPFEIDEALLQGIADRFLFATKNASDIYQKILQEKGADHFVAEVSMDEVENPQNPVELFFILSALSLFEVPMHTIAPKFTGRFNKGVDYVGDLKQFSLEFEQDLMVIDYAIKEFNLPADLKLSVHSGSDKFSIYETIRTLIKKHDKGLHVKTAGTTWLEELIGLALSGGDELQLAKDIYKQALARFDELTGPYATVIDIDKAMLPIESEIAGWDGTKYANSLRHIEDHADYNPHFRQLLHCGYKIAAEMGDQYIQALKDNREIIAQNVTENLFDRHIKHLFIG